MDSEEYFPRGGKKPTTTYFKPSGNFLGAAEKGERKKKKLKKKSEDDDGYLSDEITSEVDQSYKNCAIWLNYKVVKEGLLMLGRVYNTTETKVLISLPCRMSGAVMACHISEAYNKILEAYVNDQIDKVQELPQMFRRGQYVAVKILEVATDNLMLTMMPQHINAGRVAADLHKGALLQAAVSSVEDHGYVMDIGIPNTRAFLPKDAANPEINLETGMLTWVVVKSLSPSECTVVTLSGDLEALQKAVQRKKTASLPPATALEFVVNKALDNGIEGRIIDNTSAYIQRHQADSFRGKKPALGQKIRARVLYSVPPNNTPFLTMKSIFNSTYPDLEEEQKLKDGDIVEDAQVLKIMGRSIQFKLGEGSIGILSLRRVQVHEDLSDEQVLAKSYPLGSTHKVRVLCYNLSDYVYSVSDEAGVLNERYFSLAGVSAGEMLPGRVISVADNHLKVKVGRLNGFVPQTHMTDAGIFVDPKRASNPKLPKKKFKVGQEVQARVLQVDSSKQQLVLTLKPSLLTADLDVLDSYEGARVGKAYTGVVVKIRDFLLVSFFNNVIAYVPRHLVSASPPENLAEAFHIGQIVKCTIMSVSPENKRMSGSLTNAPFTPSELRNKGLKRKNNDQEVSPKKQKLNEEGINKKNKQNNKIKTPDVDESQGDEKKNIKKKKQKDAEPNNTAESNIDTEQDSKSSKKKKKNKSEPDIQISNNEEIEVLTKDKKTKNKKGKENKQQKEASEESDAIETDIHEDSDQVLTPQDLHLIDLSECVTAKTCKKKVVSLLKAIKARVQRINRIEIKIKKLEDKGINAENKKIHTAMHMEKFVMEERLKKLTEVLKVAEGKCKEFDIEFDEDKESEKNEESIDETAEVNEESIETAVESESPKKKRGKKDKKKKEQTTNIEETVEKQEFVAKEKLNKVEKKEKKRKLEDDKRKVKVLEQLQPAIEVPSAKDFWSLEANTAANNANDEESSSSDEEEQEKPKKKRKKLTIAEKLARAREEEERVRRLERAAGEGEGAPRSSDQFERALLSAPNSSQLWIAYMAFHLQATEIEKARAVAKKALNTINFREEDEKLNVWLALLNLEHRFGTKESQQKTLEDALQMNDTYRIHSKLLDILVDTSKPQELVSVVELMMRKYRGQERAYRTAGEACYKAGLLDKARQVMQKGIAALEKKEHVSLLVRFACLERAHGSRERAEALFEQVLAVYPQRVDVCAAYADMLLKEKDIEHLRQVMERMTSQKLPARKMKVLFKKWAEVEEKLGDEESAARVRQRAQEFVSAAKF